VREGGQEWREARGRSTQRCRARCRRCNAMRSQQTRVQLALTPRARPTQRHVSWSTALHSVSAPVALWSATSRHVTSRAPMPLEATSRHAVRPPHTPSRTDDAPAPAADIPEVRCVALRHHCELGSTRPRVRRVVTHCVSTRDTRETINRTNESAGSLGGRARPYTATSVSMHATCQAGRAS
jgi:hypothetical protein